MKRLFIICLITIFFLVGCGSSRQPLQSQEISIPTTTPEPTTIIATTVTEATAKPTSTVPPSTTTKPTTTEPPTTTAKPTTTVPPSQGVQVDKGLIDVTITLPKEYFENMKDFDPDAYTKEQGFKRTVINGDGSVCITMSKSKHNELMTDMKATIDQSFSELVRGEDTPYITAITSTDGYKEVTVEVDRAGYESAFDMTPFLIGVSALMFQQYGGIELHCNVVICDEISGESLTSVVFP